MHGPLLQPISATSRYKNETFWDATDAEYYPIVQKLNNLSRQTDSLEQQDSLFEPTFLAHQKRKSVVLAWDRNPVPGVLTQASYINALQFFGGVVQEKESNMGTTEPHIGFLYYN